MAQTGYTPIKLYASSTASAAPLAANLDNTNGAELAINTADGKLFYKDSGGNVQVIGYKVVPYTAGGTGLTAAPTNGQIPIGTGTGYALNTISNGTNISVTNGSGSITVGITGTIAIANGGTNATATPTAGGVSYGTGTAYAFTSAGTTGQVLTSNGAGVPTWETASSGISTGKSIAMAMIFGF